jgi:hypothetical protein
MENLSIVLLLGSQIDLSAGLYFEDAAIDRPTGARDVIT